MLLGLPQAVNYAKEFSACYIVRRISEFVYCLLKRSVEVRYDFVQQPKIITGRTAILIV